MKRAATDRTLELFKPERSAVSGTAQRALLRRLAREHALPQLRAAIVKLWATAAGLAPNALRASKAVEALLGHSDQALERELAATLEPVIGGLDLKGLEGAFEVIQDASARKEQGSVYTPTFIIDHLLTEGLALAARGSRSKWPVVCDPACGSGGFLVRAASLFSRKLGLALEKVVDRHLVGFDVDPTALAQAAAILDLLLISNERPPRSGQLRLFVRDTLISSGADLLEVAGEPKGFGLVVTNPPYVKIQNLPESYRRQLEQRFPDLTFGSYALAPLALVAYAELLAKDGCVAVITQNNLFTSLSGEPVRRHLQEHGMVRRIVDFGHQHIFEDASAYTCLVYLGREAREAFEFASVKDATSTGLNAACYSPIRSEELHPRKWRLGSPVELECLRKIEGAGTPLGEATRIRVGFATLKDAVFFVDGEGSSHCTAMGADDRPMQIERGLTRPAVKIAAMRSEAEVKSNPRRIIFPYEKVGARYQLLPESRLRSEFPRTYEYLCQHREKLAERDKGKRAYDCWYAWGRTQGMDAPGPKLLTRTFDSHPRFFLDASDQLFCNGYGLFARDEHWVGAGLEVLQVLLNSHVMHFYVKVTSFQIDGNFQCYQKNFIERFGIPQLRAAQQERLLVLAGEERERFVAEIYGVPYDDIVSVLPGAAGRGSRGASRAPPRDPQKSQSARARRSPVVRS